MSVIKVNVVNCLHLMNMFLQCEKPLLGEPYYIDFYRELKSRSNPVIFRIILNYEKEKLQFLASTLMQLVTQNYVVKNLNLLYIVLRIHHFNIFKYF